VVKEKRYRDTGTLHSDGKIELFYKSVIVGLMLATLVIAMMSGFTLDKPVTWKWWDFTVLT
jgi:hypothetical protein